MRTLLIDHTVYTTRFEVWVLDTISSLLFIGTIHQTRGRPCGENSIIK
jgi:hypothetical protein